MIILAIFAWPICYLTKPSYRYYEEVDNYVGATRFIQNWYSWLVCLFGFIVAISRMRDKLLRAKLYNAWMVMTCRRRKCVKFDEFEKLVQETALNTFLKTSLNTELVITILKGITILAASSSDKIDHMNDTDMYRIKQTTTIMLNEVKISNAKDFTLTSSGRATISSKSKH